MSDSEEQARDEDVFVQAPLEPEGSDADRGGDVVEDLVDLIGRLPTEQKRRTLDRLSPLFTSSVIGRGLNSFISNPRSPSRA